MVAKHNWSALDPRVDAFMADGLSVPELAEIMGISAKAIHYRLWRRGISGRSSAQIEQRKRRKEEAKAHMEEKAIKRDCLGCRKTFATDNRLYFMCPTCRPQACDMGAYSVSRGATRHSGHR